MNINRWVIKLVWISRQVLGEDRTVRNSNNDCNNDNNETVNDVNENSIY
jgi:hypothetical protein